MYVIFAKNLEPRKSAIAMSIFTKASDRGDFRDLDRVLAGVHYILILRTGGSCGRRKFGSKNCTNFLALRDG